MKRSIFSLLFMLGMLATVIGHDSGGSSEGNSGTEQSISVEDSVSADCGTATASYEAHESASGSTGDHSVTSREVSYVESCKSNLTSAYGLTNKFTRDKTLVSS